MECFDSIWEGQFLKSSESDPYYCCAGPLLGGASAISPTEVIIQVDSWTVVFKMFPFCISIERKLKLKAPLRFVFRCLLSFQFYHYFRELSFKNSLFCFLPQPTTTSPPQQQLHLPNNNFTDQPMIAFHPFKRDWFSQPKETCQHLGRRSPLGTPRVGIWCGQLCAAWYRKKSWDFGVDFTLEWWMFILGSKFVGEVLPLFFHWVLIFFLEWPEDFGPFEFADFLRLVNLWFTKMFSVANESHFKGFYGWPKRFWPSRKV